jgi:aminoglycoside phosphotransferase (APT) family kinase protein
LNGGVPSIPPADLGVSRELVVALLADQFPQFAGMPLTWFAHGWDNETFALGDALLVRVPRRAATVKLLHAEQRWLPVLATRLPVPVPVPVFTGLPSPRFPYPWSIVTRLHGSRLADRPARDRGAAAEGLADFFSALHRPAPEAAPHNPSRGVPLADRDDDVRQRLGGPGGFGPPSLELWQRWCRTTPHVGPALWLHADSHPLNLLVDDGGRLAAVLDWGDVTAGDPAVDLASGWLAFDAEDRQRFMRRCDRIGNYDPDAWTRAKAWALALAAMFRASGDAALAPIAAHAWTQLRAEP